MNNVLKSLSIDEKIRLFNGEGSWKTYSANNKLPQIFMSDGPHGLRKQDFENYADLNKSNTATCFPTASCIASSWDINVAKLLGKSLAKEAVAENVQLVLGPGMNIKRSPLCGRNFEYFSEDPLLTGKLASNYVKGMQESGVGACIKHFACNNQEKRRQTSSSNVDEQTLRNLYLKPFEYVVKSANPSSIMCSYNKINGVYACHNKHLLTEILRDEWKYEGTVISDWGACIDPVKCIKSGLDLAMPDSNGYFDKQIRKAFLEGKITEEEIEVANERTLKLVEKTTLHSKGENKSKEEILTENNEVSLHLAEQSAVLLKNDNILPLNSSSVTIIGELAENMKFQGGGSSHITYLPQLNVIEEFKKNNISVTYAKGYNTIFYNSKKVKRLNQKYLKEALLVTEQAFHKNEPILFFCGLTEAYEGEGFDRKNLSLPEEQVFLLSEILKITTNVILISFSGAPIIIPELNKIRAHLHMYLAGQSCGQAVVNLITGKVTPSGKLAETWPLKIEDTPCFNNFSLENDEVNYNEKELVGYRWYASKNIPVQFPFGFGLSYTTFETKLQDYTVSQSQKTALLNFSVKNTGNYEGSEVIQVYLPAKYNFEEDKEKLNNLISYEPKADYILAGFSKIYLKKNEEKNVSIEVDDFFFPKEIKGEQNKNQPVKNEYRKFTSADSLGDMAKKSKRIRLFLKIIEVALLFIHKGKSKEDPAIKIELAAIYENPLESLISTSGGVINEKLTKTLVRWANK